jgi:hypothetical protein
MLTPDEIQPVRFIILLFYRLRLTSPFSQEMLIRPTFRYLSRVVPFTGRLPYFEPVGQEVVVPPAIITAPAAASSTLLAVPSRGRSIHSSPPRLLGSGPLAYQEPEDVVMESITQCK